VRLWDGEPVYDDRGDSARICGDVGHTVSMWTRLAHYEKKRSRHRGSRHLPEWDAREIDRAYFPWIGALHSLLDSLVDRGEDREGGRPCLLDYYASWTEEATRLADLAIRARDHVARLPTPRAHRVIVTAMCSYYLSAPECDSAEAQLITHALSRAIGLQLRVAVAMFRARRLAAALTGDRYA
jgi:hypothetical protein